MRNFVSATETLKRGQNEPASLAAVYGQAVGAAVHSLRAVPPPAARRVAEWAMDRAVPLHVHCSEQQAENEEVLAAYGATPVELLVEAGALSPGTVAVHATHLSRTDVEGLGASGAGVCMCPTTERDLGDGIGPLVSCLGSARRFRSGAIARRSWTPSRRCAPWNSTKG